MPFIPPSRGRRSDASIDGSPVPDVDVPRRVHGPKSTSPGDVSSFQVRRMMTTHRDASLVVAQRIGRIVQRVGRTEVDASLGDEAADLVAAYEALRSFVLAIDPTADFPNLPE